MSKLHIKKGDTVYVNAGRCKSQTGKVVKVLVDKQRAIVEGVNMVSKSQKPSAKNPQGGIVKMEAPITKKPADVRMGKGKGDPVGYVFPITPGRIIFEIEGVPFEVAKEALRLAAQKLPVTTKFVVRHDYDKNA